MKAGVLYYLLIALGGYFLTYPLKVIMVNEDISLLPIAIATGWSVLGLAIVTHKGRFVASREGLLLVGFIALLVISYVLTAQWHAESTTLAGLARKHFVYAIVALPVLVFSTYLERIKGSSRLNLFFLALSVAQLCAVLLNSIAWQVPVDALARLDIKYVVGPLLRAGAGYLDPNFLAINFILLLFLAQNLVTSRILRFLSCSCLVIGTFLTFSRAGWLVLFLLFVIYIVKKRNGWILLASVVTGIVVLGIVASDSEFGFLLRRFSDAEGMSSVEDRFFQYRMALSEVFYRGSEASLLFGFGGPDWFAQKYGVHLHNFYLGVVIDSGWPAAMVVIGVLMMIIRWSAGAVRVIVIAWALLALFLPSVPDTFYLLLLIFAGRAAIVPPDNRQEAKLIGRVSVGARNVARQA